MPVGEIYDAVRFRVGVGESLISVHFVPASGELGEESGHCEDGEKGGSGNGEVIEGEKRLEFPRKSRFLDVGKERQPFSSKKEERAEDKCVGGYPIEKPDHSGNVDDEHEHAEAEER